MSTPPPWQGPTALSVDSPFLDISHQLNPIACGFLPVFQVPESVTQGNSLLTFGAEQDSIFFAVPGFIYLYADLRHWDGVEFGTGMNDAVSLGVEAWRGRVSSFLGQGPCGGTVPSYGKFVFKLLTCGQMIFPSTQLNVFHALVRYSSYFLDTISVEIFCPH